MGKSKQQKKGVPAPREQEPPLKDFLDRVAPGVIQFRTDHYLCGNTFRCVWALREYPTATKELALLRRLGERSGVTLHIYHRMVDAAEEERILHAAENRDRLRRSGSGRPSWPRPTSGTWPTWWSVPARAGSPWSTAPSSWS